MAKLMKTSGTTTRNPPLFINCAVSVSMIQTGKFNKTLNSKLDFVKFIVFNEKYYIRERKINNNLFFIFKFRMIIFVSRIKNINKS